jgi:toxin ParE1/3/4
VNAARWSQRARTDLANIDDFYEGIAPEYAERVGMAALAAGRFLAEHPKAGTPLLPTGERKWRVPGTPYVLVYLPMEDDVEIPRLYHVRRDWLPQR